jgi:acetyl-CoA carboxylase biotin carboxyl carrier protein
MKPARLKALIDLVTQSRLTELEIIEGGERVRIARPSAPARPPMPTAVVARNKPMPPVAPQIPASDPPAERLHELVVASPMFGVFHRAPSPDAAPFVEAGHQVKSGDKLCVIEAMKSFNLIHADADGTVTAILVENGQEVESGQPLFRIGR